MGKVKIISNPVVKEKFKKYPNNIKPKLNHLRKLIVDIASDDESIT